MPHLLWLLGLFLAFGLGLAAGGWLRPEAPATQEIERLREAESRLRSQVIHLRGRLPGGDASLADQGRAGAGHWDGSHAAGTRAADRSVVAGTIEAYERHGRLAPADGGGAAGLAGRGTSPPSTVRDALERFHRYLDESNGSGGLARWQRTQQLTEDLRGMGRAGEDALMRVLSSATSSDERRAAAQLLGELQVPRALPILQDVIEQDSDLLLRRAAASGLRRLQTPESIPVLEAILANPGEDRFVRMSAASGLAQMDRSLGVAGLMQIFEEATADGRGRALAFRALTSLNDERALPFMRQLVSSDAELSYRLRAIRFLSAQGDRQALPSLQQLMRSPTEQPSIREAAARAHATIASQ